MNRRILRVPVGLAVGLLAAGGLAACGGSSSGATFPKTSANVTVCDALAQALSGQSSMSALAGAVLESNAPVSQQLRQDIGNYITLAASGVGTEMKQAEAKARQDCASLGT
ncbi:MAG TPA: hypothetical protein VK823_19475 [Streptosporangiaceae bacterium]|jgi:hypothetical protein|nr:hypothetical protein [Streptosporangiaceae bacterium]